ncbi:MAG: hypothetical protein K2X74_13710 [Acetobacteraceae bacterium]|nr:hypothetical protein [Acetobacteraceae bacterium]
MGEVATWIVTLDGARPVAEVARALAAAGFTVEQVLDAIGSITGTADEATAARVQSLPGVSDVARDQPVDIGPPGARETW